MKIEEFVAKMRSYEQDHGPDGWPAIQMKDVSALCSIIEAQREALKDDLDTLVYVRQYFEKTGLSALTDCDMAIAGTRAALEMEVRDAEIPQCST